MAAVPSIKKRDGPAFEAVVVLALSSLGRLTALLQIWKKEDVKPIMTCAVGSQVTTVSFFRLVHQQAALLTACW